eukprot:gene5253-biopygen13054
MCRPEVTPHSRHWTQGHSGTCVWCVQPRAQAVQGQAQALKHRGQMLNSGTRTLGQREEQNVGLHHTFTISK